MSTAKDLRKLATELEQTMLKTAYRYDYEDLKDKESFLKAVEEELEYRYSEEALKKNVPFEDIEEDPEIFKEVPKETKGKRDELLKAISDLPDNSFPLVKPGKNDVHIKMPVAWYDEQSKIQEELINREGYDSFNKAMDEMIKWVKGLAK